MQLHLRGKLWEFSKDLLNLTRKPGPERTFNHFFGEFSLSFYPDKWFASDLENYISKKTELIGGVAADHGTQTNVFINSIAMMPILYQTSYGSWGYVIDCLLLQVQSGAEPGVYRRVGVAEVRWPSDLEMDLNAIKFPFRAPQKPLDRSLYQVVDEEGSYTITVV